MKQNNHAFTLIELLVVITIILALAGLSLPAIKSAIQKSNDTKAASNLRSLALAVQLYTQEEESYPTTYSADGRFWQDKISSQLGVTGGTNINKLRKDPKSILNVPDSKPASQRTGSQTSIALNHYIVGMAAMRVTSPSQIIVLGEIVEADSDRFYPVDTGSQPKPGFRRQKGTMAYMAFCDGHVEMLTSDKLKRQPTNSDSRFRLPSWPEW